MKQHPAEHVDTPDILNWEFDTLALPLHPLRYVTCEIFSHNKIFLANYTSTVECMQIFFNHLDRMYNPSAKVPAYHNAVHAADVTQAMHFLLMGSPGLLGKLEVGNRQLALLSSIFAAAIHDYDHPGLTNEFLVQSKSPLIDLYGARSPLEHHHTVSAFRLLEQSSPLLLGLSGSDFTCFRQLVVEMVLSTDLANHEKVLVESHSGEACKWLSLALHCADVSSSARPVAIHEKWTKLILAEFASQAKLNPAIHNPAADMSQVVFIDRICRPLFVRLDEICGGISQALALLEANRDRYSR